MHISSIYHEHLHVTFMWQYNAVSSNQQEKYDHKTKLNTQLHITLFIINKLKLQIQTLS